MMIKENEYGTANIQNELLDIMKLFHEFCEKHNIDYSLYGGSCLGAVRHNGFIPWDDDLDVAVDRENYKKLIGLFPQCDELVMKQTLWIRRIQKPNASAIRGYVPTLDVFVIDNVPDNPLLFRIKILLLAAVQGMLKDNVLYSRFNLFRDYRVKSTYLKMLDGTTAIGPGLFYTLPLVDLSR